MFGKLRPVGNRVPRPDCSSRPGLIWEDHYRTEFTGSGTEALSIAVAIAIAHKPEVRKPEVVIPAYGCPDLVSAILAQGGKPVLVDLLPDSPFMNDVQVRGVITPETVAVVGVNFLGISERLDVLLKVCREKNLFLIEDSAQRFPPVSSNKPLADLVVLSFGRGKPINLMGGGALLYRKGCVTESMSVIGRYEVSVLAMGFTWLFKRWIFNLLLARFPFYVLEKLPGLGIGDTTFRPLGTIRRLAIPEDLLGAGLRDFQQRPAIDRLYDRELAFLDKRGWKRLGRGACESRGYDSYRRGPRYAILAPDHEARDRIKDALNSAGIGVSAFYSRTLPKIEGLEALLKEGEFPVADDFASRLLTLPCHEDVRATDVTLIADTFRELSRG